MKKLIILLTLIPLLALAVITTIKNYQCDRCGTLIQSETSPSFSGCPSGSGHHWHNLGETGDKNYQCKRCATVVRTKESPSSSGCPKSSSHSWSKL